MASTLLQAASTRLNVLRNVPAVEASPDYAAGDLLGGKQELTGAVDGAGDGGIITDVLLTCAAGIAGADIEAVFFNADPSGTTFTENGALAIADADLPKIIGTVLLDTQVDFQSNPNFLCKPALAVRLPFVLAAGTSLFCALVSRGALNLGAVNDVQLRVVVEKA